MIFLAFTTCKKDDSNLNVKACFDFLPNNNIKVGDTITFTNCSENSIKYNWDFGDNSYSNDSITRHSYKDSGTFKILLAALNNNINKMDTLSKIIKIYPKPDNIVYHKFVPEISINTVDFYTTPGTPDWLNCESIPIPSAGSASVSVDLNGDLINDFSFEAHHEKTKDCGSHCQCSYYLVSMSGINNTDSISAHKNKYFAYIPELYDSLALISKNGFCKDQAFLKLKSSTFVVNFVDSYIGFKINNNFGWVHVTPNNNGIIIKEYAINMTENNSIKAGQIK